MSRFDLAGARRRRSRHAHCQSETLPLTCTVIASRFDSRDRAAEAQARPVDVGVAPAAAVDRHRAREARGRARAVIARVAVARDRAAARVDVDFGRHAAGGDGGQVHVDRARDRARRRALLVEREVVFAGQVQPAGLVQGDRSRRDARGDAAMCARRRSSGASASSAQRRQCPRPRALRGVFAGRAHRGQGAVARELPLEPSA